MIKSNHTLLTRNGFGGLKLHIIEWKGYHKSKKVRRRGTYEEKMIWKVQ